MTRPCRSAGEALEAVHSFEPDVIVSDIGLPDEDGIDLIRRIRALAAGTGRMLPAVALTVNADGDGRSAPAAGFQAYLAKPVDGADLLEAIARLVRPTV